MKVSLRVCAGWHGNAFDHATFKTSFLPHAFTYLRTVAIDGECFPVANARSSLTTAGA